MKLLILGGRGHIGRQVVSALRKSGLDQVSVGSHSESSGTIRLDLLAPDTFKSVDPFDVVVNCTDTYFLPPDKLIEHCLGRPIIFVETSAEAGLYIRIEALSHRIQKAGQLVGSVLCGSGAYPGLSNLLAGRALDLSADREVELFIHWSVFSGAGEGTCEVMVQTLSKPALFCADGKVQSGPPIGSIRNHSYFRSAYYGVQLGLPESVLLSQSRSVLQCRVFVSVHPEVPKAAMKVLSWLARVGTFKFSWVQAILRAYFRLIRRRLLFRKTTPVEIQARTKHQGLSLKINDAFRAGGESIATAIDLMRAKKPGPGCFYQDKFFDFNVYVKRWNELEFQKLEIAVLANDA